MKLMHDFYRLNTVERTDLGFAYTVRLEPDHWIYKAHFPGRPVTPGVCLIQMCTELAARQTGHVLRLRRINRLKFLTVVDPRRTRTLRFAFGPVVVEGWECRLEVLVSDGTSAFAKFNIETMIVL